MSFTEESPGPSVIRLLRVRFLPCVRAPAPPPFVPGIRFLCLSVFCQGAGVQKIAERNNAGREEVEARKYDKLCTKAQGQSAHEGSLCTKPSSKTQKTSKQNTTDNFAHFTPKTKGCNSQTNQQGLDSNDVTASHTATQRQLSTFQVVGFV